MINDLDYESIKFPVSRKDSGKIEKKNNFCINVFCCENNLVHPVPITHEKTENCIKLFTLF